ncbi:MAG: multiprotein-bridging factor 1 family protein [Candidatus Micrarchaeota archaeon]|nr:multiprotein-bridging factor 1 family protein [Candidatus Micrarchaeota archaeon]
MECEICGKKSDKLYKIQVETSYFDVCVDCKKHGKLILEDDFSLPQKTKNIKLELKKQKIDKVLVENYGKLIQSAREKRGMSRTELARAIKEQESYLERVEKQKTLPDERLIHKLEKFLGITLFEEQEVEIPLESKNKKDDQRRLLSDFVSD